MKSRGTIWRTNFLATIKSIGIISILAVCAYVAQIYFEIPKYAFVLAFITIAYFEIRMSSLSEKIGLNELPEFNAQIEFLRQKPSVPKHDPADPSTYPMRLSEPEQQFFHDFEAFADVINFDLKETPWRIQSSADTDIGTLETDGPMFGRRYAVLFGAKKNGELVVRDAYNYTHDTPNVHVKIEIYNARRFPLWHIGSIISSITNMTCRDATEKVEVDMRLNTAMLNVLWPLNQQVVNVDELEFSYSGIAENYFRRLAAMS